MTQMEWYKADGVRDLPMIVRMLFGKALFAEQEGNTVEAEKYLKEAVEKEAELKANDNK